MRYNLPHVRTGAENELVQRSDMNDTWWTDYSILFEVLMQKLQIPHAWWNSRRMTQRRQYYHLVHGYIKSHDVLNHAIQFNLLCITNVWSTLNSNLLCSYAVHLKVQDFRCRNRYKEEIVSEMLLERWMTVSLRTSSFEIKHVWEMKEVIFST